MHGVVCQHSAYHSIDLSVVTDNIHKNVFTSNSW